MKSVVRLSNGLPLLPLLTLAACQTPQAQAPTVATPASTPAVTRLESPIATTTLESTPATSTTPTTSTTTKPTTPATSTTTKPTTTKLETSKPTQTTTPAIQKTLSDLKAETTTSSIRINLPDTLLFGADKPDIRPAAKPTLAKVDQLLRYYSKSPVAINGHTDDTGNDAQNQKLSEKRAAAVKQYLVKTFGARPDRLEAHGYGETQPIAQNAKPDGSDNPDGRQKNRRVEIIIRTAAKGP